MARLEAGEAGAGKVISLNATWYGITFAYLDLAKKQ
jgi:hypothetical protein